MAASRNTEALTLKPWPRHQVRLGALVAGVVDVVGGSPRRFFFEVLARCAAELREAERLAYFGSPGGRDDLMRYNQREGARRAHDLM